SGEDRFDPTCRGHRFRPRLARGSLRHTPRVDRPELVEPVERVRLRRSGTVDLEQSVELARWVFVVGFSLVGFPFVMSRLWRDLSRLWRDGCRVCGAPRRVCGATFGW